MVDDLKQAESLAGSNTAINYTGSGQSGGSGKNSKSKKAVKYSAGLVAGFLIVIIGVAVAILGAPIYMLRAADYNLQDSAGISGTVAVMEEQAEYVEEEMLTEGKVPVNLANDLATAGVTVGQVTANGDFVRTNEYIADIEKLDDIAVVGSGFEVHGNEGELAVLFDGEVIEASNYVEAVESNPRLYAAFSEGTKISAKYYYGELAEKAFQDMGVKRDAFDAWESTGDEEVDQKSFEEIQKGVLNVKATVKGGYDCDDFCVEANLSGDPNDIVGSVSSTVGGAQLLDTVLSSYEPYKAVSAFMATEMPIQKTVLDGDGPGNQLMNVLNRSLEVKYTDVTTGEEVKIGSSILDTFNFAAAASGGDFSKKEAANFSFDRILNVTGGHTSGIRNTKVGSNGRSESSVGVGIFGSSGSSADTDKSVSSIQVALVDSNSDIYTTIIGGNRIAAGGPVMSNMVNQQAIGAMPSDEEAVMAYSHDMHEALARKRAADRATKSPFDITSPNTFFGSIVYGMASTAMQNHAISSPLSSSLGTLISFAGDSANGMFGGALADGKKNSMLETFGENCYKSDTFGSAANIYCTVDNTIYTGYMKRTSEDWGDIGESEGYENFVKKGMKRWAWGVTDTVVCETESRLLDLLNGLFNTCWGTDEDEESGAKYVINGDNENAKKYSGYTLYNTVSSLLSEEDSTASRILKEYYAKHPQDNSRAGIAARISGLSKEQAQIALNYADYLMLVANYDASTRYAFGTSLEAPEKNELVDHSNKLGGELYCFRRDGAEYDDLRTRNYTV